MVWANDNDSDSVETYRLNLGDHIVLDNIENVDELHVPDCDLVIGGFPCQGFSVANTSRKAEDLRNKLYLQFLRIIKAKKPRYFLAENVKGLLSLERGAIFKGMLEDFKRAGYKVQYQVANAADYGVPQKRERVIIVGSRLDVPEVRFPEATHARPGSLLVPPLKPWVSVSEALSKIPSPSGPSGLHNHTNSKYKLDFNGYLGHRRLNPAEPAPTVTARGDYRGGVVVLPHPNNRRRMTARELATVQSFPLSYKFKGSQTSVYRQVANAVPPRLAEALAKSFPRG